MLSDVDSFNYNFFSLEVSFISYINLWAKFQNNRKSYLHPVITSSTFQGSVFWTLALSYKAGLANLTDVSSLYIYHFSTVIDFSSEKYSGSTGNRNYWYQ